MSRAAALAFVLGLAAFPSPAAAYEERLEISVGLGPNLVLANGVAPGGGLDLAIARGLTDRWSIGGSLRYSLNHRDSIEHRASGLVEAIWALDIVQWVPRISFGVGPLLAAANGRERIGLAGSLRFGADRITEFGLVGLELRVESGSFVDDAVPGRVTLALQCRVGWLVDRF